MWKKKQELLRPVNGGVKTHGTLEEAPLFVVTTMLSPFK